MGTLGSPLSSLARRNLSLALLLASFPFSTQANVGEAFGFGSRAASLAGAMVADDRDGFTAYTNPAALVSRSPDRLTFSYGLVLMEPSLTPIQGVIVENTTVSDRPARADNVDTDYRATFGQVIGFSYRLAPNAWNLAFGVTAFMPVEQLAHLDSGEAFVPEYPLYRARTQRSQFEFGFGAAASESFRFGLGVHVGYSLTSTTNVYLTSDSSKPSSMRFIATMKPKAAPFLGMLWTPSPEAGVGLVTRLPLNSDNKMTVRSAANLSTPSFDLNFLAASTLVHDPLTLELGGYWQHSTDARLIVQADYQAWSRYKPPVIEIQDPKLTSCSPSCGLEFSGSQNPAVEYLDIVVPRVAEEIRWGSTTLRLGYAYRASIMKTGPSGQGNYLDPPKHMANIGLGREFAHLLGHQHPWSLDFHFSYHQLVTQSILKDAGTIGAPGYEAGGKILGGGVSLTLGL